MIEQLPRVIPSRPGRPEVGNADHPMRRVTQQIAFEPGGWTSERQSKVASLFDGLAPDWNSRFTAEESWQPIDDAFDRGGPMNGPCLEVGAGTGLATARLAMHFEHITAVDVSLEMLRRFAKVSATPMLADAGTLPIRSGSVGAIVAVNAFLFPDEYDRVLAPGGAILWVNSLGDATPIHLPTDDVVRAMPGQWRAVTSEAGWGVWAVLHRASAQ